MVYTEALKTDSHVALLKFNFIYNATHREKSPSSCT